MSEQRNHQYRKLWSELVDIYGSICFYCHKEIATTIDHVVPYSWDQDSHIDNLVPACLLCNLIASDKMFDSVDHKRQHILREREKRINQRAICTDCMLPFSYRTHSPSMFLCAECYDDEYDTKYSQTKEWRRWLIQLAQAGIPPTAHRNLRKKSVYKKRDKKAKLECLIGEYTVCLSQDSDFMELLLNP